MLSVAPTPATGRGPERGPGSATPVAYWDMPSPTGTNMWGTALGRLTYGGTCMEQVWRWEMPHGAGLEMGNVTEEHAGGKVNVRDFWVSGKERWRHFRAGWC